MTKTVLSVLAAGLILGGCATVPVECEEAPDTGGFGTVVWDENNGWYSPKPGECMANPGEVIVSDGLRKAPKPKAGKPKKKRFNPLRKPPRARA